MGTTPEKPDTGLAKLIRDFLEKVDPPQNLGKEECKEGKAGGTETPADKPPDENIWQGLIAFEKGIFKLGKDEIKAGWAALQIVKKSSSQKGNEKMLGFIVDLEERLLERMWFLSDGLQVTLGTDLREEFARWTGRDDFFSGDEKPKISYLANQNGNTNGTSNPGGTGQNSRQPNPNRQPSNNFDQQALLRLIEDKFGSEFAGWSNRLTSQLRGATLTTWQQIVLWTGWTMNIAICAVLGYMFYTHRYVPNNTRELLSKSKVLQDSLNYARPKQNFSILKKEVQTVGIDVEAIMDSVNKMMPKPKPKPKGKKK